MIAKARSKVRHRERRDDYLALVRACPLHAIHTRAQHEQAMDMVRQLAVRGEGVLNRGEQDYLDALSVLIEDYDRRQEPWQRISGLALLKHLMQETGMKVAELGKIVGSAPLASLILSGKRKISKDVMKRLGAHFHLEPAAFL